LCFEANTLSTPPSLDYTSPRPIYDLVHRLEQQAQQLQQHGTDYFINPENGRKQQSFPLHTLFTIFPLPKSLVGIFA